MFFLYQSHNSASGPENREVITIKGTFSFQPENGTFIMIHQWDDCVSTFIRSGLELIAVLHHQSLQCLHS